ncbi:hypothetical protein JL721_12615 [Aureococcus anophagefferens]|nr:hypothetical protein JL721_12615 [Aureococcus anophagefferens]
MGDDGWERVDRSGTCGPSTCRGRARLRTPTRSPPPPTPRASAAGAFAVLDGAVLDGAALRIATLAVKALRVETPPPPPDEEDDDGDDDDDATPPDQGNAATLTSIHGSSTRWEPAVNLAVRGARAGVMDAATFRRTARRSGEADDEAAAPTPSRLVRRAVAFQRFELGGTAWCAGLWPDAVSLWEMLGKTKLIPRRRRRRLARRAAGHGRRRRRRPAAVSSALDKVTVAVVAALRPADPAVSLSRSPLDPAVLVRADGSVASAHEPILLARHCGGPDKSRDILLCLFDRRLAVKRPYLHEDAMRPELILTLLDAAEPPATPPLSAGAGGQGSGRTIERGRVALDATLTTPRGSGYFYREFTAPGGEVTKAFLFNGEDSKVMAGVLCFVYGDALVDDHLDLLNDYGATAALLRAAKRLDIHGLAVWVEACLESTMDVAGLPALIDALGPISAPPHARPATPAEAALHAAPLAAAQPPRGRARLRGGRSACAEIHWLGYSSQTSL